MRSSSHFEPGLAPGEVVKSARLRPSNIDTCELLKSMAFLFSWSVHFNCDCHTLIISVAGQTYTVLFAPHICSFVYCRLSWIKFDKNNNWYCIYTKSLVFALAYTHKKDLTVEINYNFLYTIYKNQYSSILRKSFSNKSKNSNRPQSELKHTTSWCKGWCSDAERSQTGQGWWRR